MFGVVRSSGRSGLRLPLQEFCRHYQHHKPSAQATPQYRSAKQHTRLQGQVLELKSKVRARMEPAEAESQPNTFATHNFTTIEAQMMSLQSKGFLRKYLTYEPPSDVQSTFLKICCSVLEKDLTKADFKNTKLTDPETKFKLLASLGKEFNHFVHNSRLRDMKNLNNIYMFYTTPVDMKNPYDRLCSQGEAGELPPNLHIQKDAFRFTGKGDNKLDQVTAYPRSSTIVSGLYTRDKYTGVETELDAYSEADYE
jgi:large subunit ribosomal protein L50